MTLTSAAELYNASGKHEAHRLAAYQNISQSCASRGRAEPQPLKEVPHPPDAMEASDRHRDAYGKSGKGL